MSIQNKENLSQLLGKFYDPEQAGLIEKDIHAGERIFELYPAPKPDQYLLNSIKVKVTETLSKSKSRRPFIYRIASIAAVIIFAAIFSLQLVPIYKPEVVKAALLPAAIWESDEITAADSDLALLTAQVQQIEEEFDYIQTNSYSDSYSAVSDLEMELFQIDNDFWKG